MAQTGMFELLKMSHICARSHCVISMLMTKFDTAMGMLEIFRGANRNV